MLLDLLLPADQRVGGAVELHHAHGLEVGVEQFVQGAAVAQPVIGGPFGAGSGHAGDDGADRRSALRTVETQLSQQRDELHLLHGPQAEVFDAD